LSADKNQSSLFSQIKTGQVKSMISALLAAVCVIDGNRGTIAITTSNMYLAERDASKFEKFFERIGASCATFGGDSNLKRETNAATPVPSLSRAKVAYTTVDEIAYDHLRAQRDRRAPFYGDTFPYLICDEGDVVYLDNTASSYRLIVKSRIRFYAAFQLKGFSFYKIVSTPAGRTVCKPIV